MVGFELGWIGCEGREEVGERGSGKAKDFVGRMGGGSSQQANTLSSYARRWMSSMSSPVLSGYGSVGT